MKATVLPLFFLLAAIPAAPAMAAASPEDLLKEAQKLEESRSVQQAVKIYQDFLKQYPDHSQRIEVLYRLAKGQDALGMVEECIGNLKLVVASDKKQFRNRQDALYTLGKSYASIKKHGDAVEAFEKLLGEGAGIHEEEVLGLVAGFYALQQKYDQAAAKLNILKRKSDPEVAQSAAWKLAMLWLKADKLDLAIPAIQEFVQQYPNNKQIPELLLRAADAYRLKQQYDRVISICEQLKKNYPQTVEATAGSYLLGLCYRDRKEFQKAADVLDAVGKAREFAMRAVAAEALLQAADIYLTELKDSAKAMIRYEQAYQVARESDSARKNEILEQCYFRLAEHYFQAKSYSSALDYYLLMRKLGTQVNILGRILACQEALNKTDAPETATAADVKAIQDRIAANPGTAIAAEAEVFLLNRKLAEAETRKAGFVAVGDEFAKLLTRYSKEILQKDYMGAYINAQVGVCYANGSTREDLTKGLRAFEKVIEADNTPANPYRLQALESIAAVAERLGDKARSADAYRQLFEISKQRLDQGKNDKDAEKQALGYLKSLLTRSDSGALVDDSIQLTRKLIQERGQLSDLSREAWYYLAELYYLKKDFSQAARTYREFIGIYGPKLDAKGDVEGGPWKPAAIDEKTAQVYDAALRVAHCWYMQRHDQNTVLAYQWLAKNLPHQNKHLAEANYWLAMELLKSKDKDAKRKAAEALWLGVVGKSLDFDDSKLRSTFHFWVTGGEAYAESQRYVRMAMLRAGQLFGESADHDSAAGAYKAYLATFAPRERGPKHQRVGGEDDNYEIARYALGREYIAMKNTPRLVETYKPYLTGLRDSAYRPSALYNLGFYAGQMGQLDVAVDAYAALLDEYGQNRTNEKGQVLPVPADERLRQQNKGWDGIRMPVPKDMELGQVRFALGFVYWKNEDWTHCIRALGPFLTDKALEGSKSRPQALYMLGQSHYRQFNYADGVKVIHALVRQHPRFEAAEEAYVQAARGYYETKNWTELALIAKTFIAEWPRSDRRTRMDLYAILADIGLGKSASPKSALKGLAGADTYEDVKADAWYHLAMYTWRTTPAALDETWGCFEKSLSYPRETSCLDAAKCAIKMEKWERAKELLDRVGRDFPKGDPRVVAESKDLLSAVLKELAKINSKKK